MNQKEYEYSISEIEKELPNFQAKGITELTLHDKTIANDRGRLLHFLQSVEKHCPSLFIKLPVSISVLDMDVCRMVSRLFCSLDIPFTGTSKKTDNGEIFLFDKKRYAGKASLLNEAGIVFGFTMDFANLMGDSLRLFRERFDFALSLYPNHIYFPQIEDDSLTIKSTATFSTQDIRAVQDLAFACKTFYTLGRAVPWFLAVLAPLKIQPSRFFADFAEWQRCNNCNKSSGFNLETTSHQEIEKMQLVFLALKYEEKHKETLMPIVNDIVRLNGAFARLVGEGLSSEVKLSYNPDDLFSPDAMNISSFADNVLLEPCTVKVFAGEDGPDYKVVS